MEMKYILVGIPYAGKTTLGKQVAEKLGLPFYDTDKLAAERIKLESYLDLIRPSFARKGVDEQVKVLFELIKKDERSIIATGASLPVDGGCADILPNVGAVILIKRSIDSAHADAIEQGGLTLVRIEDGKPVPGSEINFGAKAIEGYASDLPLLESIADFIIENDGGIEDGVEKLTELIQSLDGKMSLSDLKEKRKK